MEDSLGSRSGSGRVLTVADYLRAEEMEEIGEEAEEGAVGDGDWLATFECMTPGGMVARWVRKLRRRKKDGGRMHAKCSTKCACEKTSTSLGLVEEDATPKDSVYDLNFVTVGGQQEAIPSFKLDAGLGLALVVAAGNHELNNMLELRKEMEMIVENAEVGLGGKAAAGGKSQLCENQTCSNSTTNVEESMNSNGRVSDLSYTGSPYIEIDDKAWSDGRCDKGRCVSEGMARLESELEAELQLLELQLEGSEDTSTDNEESSNSGCESASYDEEMKHGNEPMDVFAEAHYGGVPPLELERRLHELLQSQQQERIKELEAALRRAKQKLKKKEVEARWWRDTARLISQHVSKIAPGYVPSVKDQTHVKFR